MLHLPFILHHELSTNEGLLKIWNSVTSILRIMQIVFSYQITQNQKDQLKEEIAFHLQSVKENFADTPLIPKHHLLIHYPLAIERTRPPIHSSMMRMEAKHTDYTRISNKLLQEFIENIW